MDGLGGAEKVPEGCGADGRRILAPEASSQASDARPGSIHSASLSSFSFFFLTRNTPSVSRTMCERSRGSVGYIRAFVQSL